MKRFMVHLRSESYSPKDATELLYKARSLIERDGLVVRDTRVSKKYIEFDISMPSEHKEQSMIDRLATISPLASVEEVTERHLPKEDAITLAVQAFNDEKYWSAHELLEGVWKSAAGDEKRTLNGIILVAAAFVHDEKAETEICLSILRRALAKLENSQGLYFGIDIDMLATRVAQILSSGSISRFTI
jgi:hypothetical protein